MHRALLSAVLSVSALLSTLVAAQDASYTFITFDVPGAIHTEAHGINETGQIVGWFQDATGVYGFLKEGTTFTTIDVPDAEETMALGINETGQIVGRFTDATTHTYRGFLWDNGTFTPIDVPQARGTLAWGINTAGLIVGEFNDGTTPTTGFVKDGTTFTTFDVPGSSNTRAFGINETGQIVGDFHDGIRTYGFLKDGTTFTTIDVPGARETQAFGINTAGQIVGVFTDTTGLRHGFLKDGTTFSTIDVPGSMSRGVFGINETGQIVGYSSDAMRQHGFVATPAGVDTSPSVITVTASPAMLSPPNGRLVTVTVSGTITDKPFRFGVNSAVYQVMDEYGQIQPSGSVTLGADGRYAFTVALQASRRGNDQDGRRYTIVVSATDNAGNSGSESVTVTVPRN